MSALPSCEAAKEDTDIQAKHLHLERRNSCGNQTWIYPIRAFITKLWRWDGSMFWVELLSLLLLSQVHGGVGVGGIYLPTNVPGREIQPNYTTHQVTNLKWQQLEGHPKTCSTVDQPQWKGFIWSPQSMKSVPCKAVEWSCWVSANMYWALNMASTTGNTMIEGVGLLTWKEAPLGQRDTSQSTKYHRTSFKTLRKGVD